MGDSTRAQRHRTQLSCDQCRVTKRKVGVRGGRRVIAAHLHPVPGPQCDRNTPCGRCRALEEECTFHRAKQTKSALRSRRQSKLGALQEHASSTAAIRMMYSTSASTHSSHAQILDPHALPLLTPGPSPASVTATTSCDGDMPALEAVECFLLLSSLLRPLLDTYFRELEPMSCLLHQTRVQRLMELDQGKPLLEHCPPSLRPAMRLLLLAVVGLTAQMHPTEVEATLLSAKPGARSGFATALSLEQAAYHAAQDSLDAMAATTPIDTWAEECFAASYLLRTYEKFAGRSLASKEGILVDMARLQQAGLHRSPRLVRSRSHRRASGVVDAVPWPEEALLLAYRVFWAYFDKDRTTAWITGAGYLLHAKHSNICLRDPFGHLEISHVACVLPGDTEWAPAKCGCSIASMGTSLPPPTLSAFAGANVRLGAIMGRFVDQMGTLHSPEFKWPRYAEQLADDLEGQLGTIERDVEAAHLADPCILSSQQRDVIALLGARIRSDYARLLCDTFADVLAGQGKSEDVISWILTRRRLDMAANLVDLAADMTSRAAMHHSQSGLMLLKFVNEQVLQLLQDLSPWLSVGEGPIPGQPRVASADGAARQYLLSRLRAALTGRNLSVLLTRHNALHVVREIMPNLRTHFKTLLHPFLTVDEGSRLYATDTTLDEYALVDAIEQRLPHLGATPAASTGNVGYSSAAQSIVLGDQADNPALSIFDDDVAGMFMELPALEHLLWPMGLPYS